MEIRNFADAYTALAKSVPPLRSFREAYTLEKMQKLMEVLGNPQDQLKIIHVAGTSGKTSTCYFLAAFLKQTGKKVGLTVSPHIDEINERVQINLKPLGEKKFCALLEEFLKKVEATNLKPTYFEILIAFAYWVFAKEKVDYAVIEVGLGGLLDGTNVINNPKKVCVITDIGLDHTDMLGRNIEDIAAQKAGIIRPHNTVLMYEQDNNIMEVVREVADSQQAELHEIIPMKGSELPRNLPLFQRRNWYLAEQVYEYLRDNRGLPALDEKGFERTTQTYIPARMEIVKIGDKTLIMDGAHNAQKMEALRLSVQKLFPNTPVATLLSLVQSKNFKVRTSVKEITKMSSAIIVTSFKTTQDLRKISVEPRKVSEHCRELGFNEVLIEPNPKEALELLLARPEKVLLITGSFYLLNHIRPHIQEVEK
jgi:dihydrofolate synthase / folylpolyglutamate synthase